MQSHKGFITVKSEIGIGTTFRVFIPIATIVMDEPEPSEPGRVLSGHGEGILVVDDETGILNTTKHLLEWQGYTVFTACDGIDAINTLSEKLEIIEVVITDVMMPNMDGVGFTRAARKLKPGLAIIAVSGHSHKSHHEELNALGISEFLFKPFKSSELLAAVKNAVESGKSSAAPELVS